MTHSFPKRRASDLDRLPKEVGPVMGPITSIMGEIQFVGLAAEGEAVSQMDLRALADWTLRPRLMAIPGISQVVVMGGEVKQYQIMVSRSEEHTSELQSLMRISSAVFCLKKK